MTICAKFAKVASSIDDGQLAAISLMRHQQPRLETPMRPKLKKPNAAAGALTSALFRQRKRPSKKLYRRRARTKNAGLRDQAGGFVCDGDSRLQAFVVM